MPEMQARWSLRRNDGHEVRALKSELALFVLTFFAAISMFFKARRYCVLSNRGKALKFSRKCPIENVATCIKLIKSRYQITLLNH